MTFGSLFSGIGGLDLGLERAGMMCRWQSETNAECRRLLSHRWPNVTLYGDARKLIRWKSLEAVDVLCGGDPCPKHSRARSNGESNSPDLSGYFLALVHRLLPFGVVRENVPSPTVAHFATALETIGYGTAVIRIDAAKITGQSRQRDFVVGLRGGSRQSIRALFPECIDGSGPYTTRLGTGPVTPALTCHRTRYDSRDCYIWEPGFGLRILDSPEREALAGFPPDWTTGFSEATRSKMLGNSAVPECGEWIGRRIMEAQRGNK